MIFMMDTARRIFMMVTAGSSWWSEDGLHDGHSRIFMVVTAGSSW